MTNQRIILTTLNARYIHASLGLRYLYANLDELQSLAKIIEFTISLTTTDIVTEITKYHPKIVGFGVYIWNIQQTKKVVAELKQQNPDIVIIIGGPEVSYEFDNEPIFKLSDYLITGQADLMFKSLCEDILQNKSSFKKVIPAKPFLLDDLSAPYQFYNDEDIAHRVVYVEASRGCPFKCEFCLSSLDKTAYPFDLDQFLEQMDLLYKRGARTFKFVDRTFNLKISTSIRIVEFFLERINDNLFLHFELIPDNLPVPLKELLVTFPPGSLQFEIGIQTFTEEVQSLISRRQHNNQAKQNIRWLKLNTNTHLHTDLIFGLPGETLTSFADSFNQLLKLGPDEIQLGILKRLKGTPIIRHIENYKLKFSNQAPYEIISTNLIDELTMQRVTHFSKFWNSIANSGRFRESLPLIIDGNSFERFLILSDYLFSYFKRTHSIPLEQLFVALESYYSDDAIINNTLKIDRSRVFNKRRISKKSNSNQRQIQHLTA